ncbi:MAG: FtsX-like permease family protein, partial [Acidobacteriota bacterium]
PRLFSLRNGLVIAQVTVSTLLLVAAGLLLRALDTARAIDVGFDPERVAVVSVQLDLLGYSADDAQRFLQAFETRAAEVPGVEQVALTTRVPFDININLRSIFPDAMGLDAEHPGFPVDVGWADPGTFDVLGVPLVAGRSFTTADRPDTPTVAIINQATAERFWPDGDAIGQRFRVGRLDSDAVEIVGVTANTKVRTVGETARPMIHFARLQRPTAGAHLIARSIEGDAASLLPALQAVAFELDPQMALADATTLDRRMAVSLFPVRMGAMLLSLFALLALVLASVGLYGVIAMSVARRHRELGVRMALGAGPGDITSMVVGGGMRLVAIGAAFGIALAALASRQLAGVLYGTSALDPVAFGAALVAIAAVALIANATPALRAARLDVVDALDAD